MSATMHRPSRTEQVLMWAVLTMVKAYWMARLWPADRRRKIGAQR